MPTRIVHQAIAAGWTHQAEKRIEITVGEGPDHVSQRASVMIGRRWIPWPLATLTGSSEAIVLRPSLPTRRERFTHVRGDASWLQPVNLHDPVHPYGHTLRLGFDRFAPWVVISPLEKERFEQVGWLVAARPIEWVEYRARSG